MISSRLRPFSMRWITDWERPRTMATPSPGSSGGGSMRNGEVHDSFAEMALMKQHQFLRNQHNIVALVAREELAVRRIARLRP
jgi:hypothetical protein